MSLSHSISTSGDFSILCTGSDVEMNKARFLRKVLKPNIFATECTYRKSFYNESTRRSIANPNAQPLEDAKSLSDMPGPNHLPYFGYMFTFLKNRGKMQEALDENALKYGPVYLQKFPHMNFVIVSDPDVAREFVHREVKLPSRYAIEPWKYWKEKHSKEFGLLLR